MFDNSIGRRNVLAADDLRGTRGLRVGELFVGTHTLQKHEDQDIN